MTKSAPNVAKTKKTSMNWRRRRTRQTDPLSPLRTMPEPARSSVLRFTPHAWAKLLFLRDVGNTEIGGFGVAAEDDLLLVEDVRLVRQRCTNVSVKFDDESVADFFEDQVDAGRRPEQFGRLWMHTHPGHSAHPSDIDEETFARCFGRSHWAVMFILARGGESYARLRFNVGPGGNLEIPAEVDFTRPFAASQQEIWQQEYEANVHPDRVSWSEDGWEGWDAQEEFTDDLLDLANQEIADDDEQEAFSHWVTMMDEASSA